MKLLILVALFVAAVADTRIAGGINANPGMFPHVVAVRHSGTLLCGGGIIGLRWILTSAQCVWGYAGTEYAYSIYAGGISLLVNEPGSIEVGVAAVYPHPNFKTKDTLYYANIGLMYLSFPLTVSPTIAIARIPTSGTLVPNGKVLELAGWGGTNARVSPILQWATLTTMAIQDCTIAVGGGANFDAAQICTYANPGPSACWYDHGSPLSDKTNPKGTTILGVTAYAGCLDPYHPTIYTSVGFSGYSTWITTISGIIP